MAQEYYQYLDPVGLKLLISKLKTAIKNTDEKIGKPGAVLDSSNPITTTNPPRLPAGQIQSHVVNNAVGPATNGNLVNIGGSGGSQFFMEWTSPPAEGESLVQRVWYRSMSATQNAWTDWTQVAMLRPDGSMLIPVGKNIFFDSTIGMAIGRGKPPADFLSELGEHAKELVSGAYMVFGDDETGGIIVGGDGIDMWAPPDNDLIRFWNEDNGFPVASIDGEGRYKGTAYSARQNEIRLFSTWAAAATFLTSSVIPNLQSNSDCVNPDIDGPHDSGAGYYGVGFMAHVSGNDADAPNATYSEWFVETKMVKLANGNVRGMQVAWGLASDGARSAYRRFYTGSWGAWGSNDL